MRYVREEEMQFEAGNPTLLEEYNNILIDVFVTYNLGYQLTSF
jgi:hypothetical protein